MAHRFTAKNLSAALCIGEGQTEEDAYEYIEDAARKTTRKRLRDLYDGARAPTGGSNTVARFEKLAQPPHLRGRRRVIGVDVSDDGSLCDEHAGTNCAALADRILDLDNDEVGITRREAANDLRRLVGASVENDDDFGIRENLREIVQRCFDTRTLIAGGDDDRELRDAHRPHTAESESCEGSVTEGPSCAGKRRQIPPGLR